MFGQNWQKIWEDIKKRFNDWGNEGDKLISPQAYGSNVASAPTPTPTPRQMGQEDYTKVINQGFTDWSRGSPPPMASMSAQLAELGSKLPHRYFPAALSLKETGGLKNSESGRINNNPFGIGPHIPYPDLPTAILGGGSQNQRGLMGILLGTEGEPSKYQKYLDTGDLAEFFRIYTPESDPQNPSVVEQVQTMNDLMDYFNQAEAKYKSDFDQYLY